MNLEYIFKEFINLVRENQSYQVSMINVDGVVLFSSDENKNGSFVNVKNISESDFVKKVIVKKKIYGFMWVKGDKDTVDMIGNLLYESLKTRIVLENNKEKTKVSLSLEEQLIKLLTKESIDSEEVFMVSRKLNLDLRIPRVAIYIKSIDNIEQTTIMDLKYKISDQQTFFSLISKKELVFYKSLKTRNDTSFKDIIKEFVFDLSEWGITNCLYFVSNIQRDYRLYKECISDCIWLSKHIKCRKDKCIFFEDYILDYMFSNTSFFEKNKLFSNCENINLDIEELYNVAEGLYVNDFNVTKTADYLYLHKNTLLYKIKKYENVFHLNIRGSFSDKINFYLQSKYMYENYEKKQLGGL